MTEQTGILIVGAGPTGLTAAVALTLAGHDVTVVDAAAEGANTSRAAVVHARSLEVLQPLGVTGELVARGIEAGRFTVRDRDRVLVPVPFDGLPTAHPYTLMLSQAETEAVLLRRFTDLGGRVLRPVRLTALTEDAAGITAEFESREPIRAQYVVGADGMHSTVREQAGIGFGGGDYAESFVLADVRLRGGALPADEVVLYFATAGMVVVAPLPGGTHRVVATVDAAPEHPDAAFVQALLDERGPRRVRAVVEDVVWSSRFRVHHRVADRYRSGRILLAGDAAHVHSPAGGQGMNTGIQDAVALADALHTALTSGDDAPLDAYAAARRPVAEQVVGLADRLTRLATVGPRVRPVRNLLLRAAGHVPAVRRGLALRLSGLVYR
ncbi:Pentachlorophenol 4-monooxygenase [Actinomadura rubteroloni]|uniref:Pentachlorophenol 4-monooxygenase n=1 Tax=Actinomadura rubteroloni TaxID=1926885 RepID=A0A2P4URU7_9ACTN|nr:FAD-dependent oxidoreductase [Actinomadura rubteroloni]POM27771.1 Pentachlorophenol 4-monooxygenase [Actinomadura rubteroloni]